MEECVALRADIPLPILLDSVARFLRKAETETAVFIQSLPDIDPETLDPNHRNCAICWDGFKLQSKIRKFSSLPERDNTPLQLPCAHIICKACIQGWLAKSASCPFCHHQCIRQEFLGDGTRDIRRRASYKEFAELAPHYLETIKPEINTYGELAAWALTDDSKDLSVRFLRIQAQLVMRKFNQFPTALEERMMRGRDGRRLLSPMRVIDYSEDGEQSDKEGDSMEEGGDEKQRDEPGDSTEEGEFEGLAYADDVLEEYGSTDEEEEEEEEEPADNDDDDDDDDYDDDGGELLDESEYAATSTAAAERGEEEEKEEESPTNDDHKEGQFTDENEDTTASTTAVAAVGTVATAMLEEEVVKDLVNEDRDEDGNGKPATEIAEEEKKEKKKQKKNGWVSLLLLGCVVLMNMGWLAMLIMTSEDCTNIC